MDKSQRVAYHLAKLLEVMGEIGNPYVIAIQLTRGRGNGFNGMLHSHLNGDADEALPLAFLMVKDGALPILQQFMEPGTKLESQSGDEAKKRRAEFENSDIKMNIKNIHVPKDYHN